MINDSATGNKVKRRKKGLEAFFYQIYALGSNSGYQLGVNDNRDRHSCAHSLFSLGKNCNDANTKIYLGISKMKCGGNHTLAILEDGRLIGSGSNSQGQLFSSKLDESNKDFKYITSIAEAIVDLTCGWEFSILETKSGKLYAAGYGPDGELGLGKKIRSTKGHQWMEIPVHRADKGKIIKIKSSIHSVIMEFANGEVYGWGNNKKGQLFDHKGDKALKQVWEPTLIKFGGSKVVDYAMGRDFTVFLLHDTSADTLRPIIRGRDRFGIGKKLETLKIDPKTFKSMHAMWSSVHFETKDGNVISVGNNSHCQSFPGKPEGDGKAITGSEHGVYVVNGNKAYCWGWGEHGNCGKQKDGSENDKFNYMNLVYKAKNGEQITGIFAGCATTFIEVKSNLI